MLAQNEVVPTAKGENRDSPLLETPSRKVASVAGITCKSYRYL